MSSTGSFSHCIQENLNAARKALFSLRKYTLTNPEISPSKQLQLFDSMIEPVINYGSEVWGLRKADPIERFHLSFLKSLLGVKSSTPNCFVYGELGVYPLSIRRNLRVVKYWLKLIKSEPTEMEYICSIYNNLFEISEQEPNKITWASLVKKLIFQCGMGNYWVNQRVDNEKLFLALFEQRQKDMFLQEWNAQKSQSSSSRLFKHIKEHFKLERYLEDSDRRAYRIAISKIRLSSHSFNIERGRWGNNKMPKLERKCQECDELEDEYHCLVECPRFVNERKGYLPVKLRQKPSMFGFIKFINSENHENIKMLGRLCYKIMKEHKKSI